MSRFSYAIAAFLPLTMATPGVASIEVGFAVDTYYLDSYTLTFEECGIDLVATAYQTKKVKKKTSKHKTEYVYETIDARVDLDPFGSSTGPGLGVVGARGEAVGDDDLEPGGDIVSETLVLSFYQTGTDIPVVVELESLRFSNVDGNDNFDLVVDGELYGDEIPLYDGGNPFDPAEELYGSVFEISADGSSKYHYPDNFKLKYLHFECFEPVTSAIPEPGSFFTWAILSGCPVALMSVRRGRRK